MRTASRQRATKETRVAVDGRPRRDRSHRHRHRYPLLRPHARPTRTAQRLRPHGARRGRPAHRHPSHRRGRRHHARRDVRRGARRQGRGAALRQRAVSRSTRRSSRSPSTCRAGRSSPGTCRSPRACRSAARRSTRNWPSTPSRRSPPTPRSRCTSRCASGRNAHHIIEATFKGLARCLRDAVRVDAAAEGVPSTKGCVVISVVDYGIGNLHSAHKALAPLGC